MYRAAKEGENNPQRQYGDDEGRDALTKIIKILYRSSGGDFNTFGDHRLCIGNYINGEDAPEFVANLVNYCYWKRLKDDQKANDFKEKIFQSLFPKITRHIKEKDLLKSIQKNWKQYKINQQYFANDDLSEWSEYDEKVPDINPALKKAMESGNINEIIRVLWGLGVTSEFTSSKTIEVLNMFASVFDHIDAFTEGPGEYDPYDLERVILSFLIFQCDTKEQVLKYMEHLDDAIVDKALLRNKMLHSMSKEELLDAKSMGMGGYSSIECLTKEDLNKKHFDVTNTDDLMMILYGEKYFKCLSPYLAEQLSANTGVSGYNRDTHKEEAFQDCFDITMLHLMDMFLYDSKDGKFQPEKLEEAIKNKIPGWKPHETFETMKDFYKTHQPDKNKVDSKETAFRNAWSGRVMSDLNHKSIVGLVDPDIKEAKIRYKKGMQEQQLYEDGKYELKTDEIFYNFINTLERLLGVPLEKLGNKQEIKLSLDKRVLEKILKGDPVENEKEVTQALEQWVKAKMEAFLSFLNTEFQGKKLIIKDLKIDVNRKSHLTFEEKYSYYFTLFSSNGHAYVTQKIPEDSNALWRQYQNDIEKIMKTNSSHKFFLTVPMDDSQYKGQYPLIWKIFSNAPLTNCLVYSYNNRHLNGLVIPCIINKQTESFLYQAQDIVALKSKDKCLYTFKELENRQEVTGISIYKCNCLEIRHMDCSKMNNLRSLTINDLKSLKVLQYDNLENLRKVEMIRCNNLEKVESGNLSKLSELYLENLPGLKELKLTTLYKLTKLELVDCENLEKVEFTDMPKLTELVCLKRLTKLKELALENLNKLTKIDLTGCSNLEKAEFKVLPELPELLLENLSSLKELRVIVLDKLKKLELANHNQLEEVVLFNSSVVSELCLKNLPNLHTLTLDKVNNLKKIMLTRCHSLKNTDFKFLSALTELYLENLKDCETLKLSALLKLTKVELRDCANLHDVNIRVCDNLKTIKYDEIEMSIDDFLKKIQEKKKVSKQ